MPLQNQITLFKVVAFAEAVSWAGLLVGMYLKHVTGTTELGVQVFGSLHGGIFLVYVGLTLVLARSLRWGVWTTLTGLAASIPPFATVAFEVWADRTGRLAAPSVAPTRQQEPVA